jgi:REP element-mobilizing transposase RayT
MSESYYERKLPHWQPEDAFVFVTWRLYGSLPYKPDVIGLPPGKAFAAFDRALDHADSGPRWLSDTRVASCMAKTLMFGEADLKLYSLRAWVIMPNHVHMLVDPKASLARITQAVKDFSARKANEILHRAGPFWQRESFDHWARNSDKAARITDYIEFNPVKAGFVKRPEDWRWSSRWAGQEAYPTLEQI